MLYKKNTTKKLDMKLFRSPTAEYRAVPFWAWNCKLEQKELEWQLEVFKKMGFGGAHMHVRTGMGTTYLSDEHMNLVKECVEKAKSEDMKAWLYDEDRWPSGAAGGLVTKDKRFRTKYLLFTPFPYDSERTRCRDAYNAGAVVPGRTEQGILLACYDVELDEQGCLVGWRVIGEKEEAHHDKWYAYLETIGEITWWNGQTYVNTLDKPSIDRFIELTYESYNRTVSSEFDETIPAIFTDEPQFPHKTKLAYATEKRDITLPWTDDLADTYAKAYEGENLIAGIPELIWNLADGKPSTLRYHYHDHVCERFTLAFADNCGKWCDEHGLALTGHVMAEATLASQTMAWGEAMRTYRGFGIPGIDMLAGRFEYTTAKQAQSVVHQFAKEGMLSELYGVTGWDFDFRGHKLHGDWQAALGVTVRVPHLSWVSMEGEAKRDYPASIHYQSPWWERYALVEDHFARVNTALTRGNAVVKVGVIHPIESYWVRFGPSDQTSLVRGDMDENFQNITKWLLFGGVDFDFISESLLSQLCEKPSVSTQVGAMTYDIILVPDCETLRSTTYEYLEAFSKAGGKVLFAGSIPSLEGAVLSERGIKLAENAICVPFKKSAVLSAVEPFRQVKIIDQSGIMTKNLLHQLRQDGDGRWLFIAHGVEPYNKHVSNYQDLKICIKGIWRATVYNTVNGEKENILQRIDGTWTELRYRMYDYDSLLVWLEPTTETASVEGNTVKISDEAKKTVSQARRIPLPKTVSYTLSEPNVLLLDCAEYALDAGEWQPEEELLRVDITCRKQLGWNLNIQHVAQPWSIDEENEVHRVKLRWHINSTIEYEGAKLAIERMEMLKLRWNGVEIDHVATGWFADKSIKTLELPKIQQGENILEADVPLSQRITIEWAYILGNFGVEICGRNTCIVPAKEELAFGDITNQGLPFYSGNITYHIPIETSGGELSIRSGYYVGAMQEVSIDNAEKMPIIYPPYTVELGKVEAGEHRIDLNFYGHRYNSFGPLHLADREEHYVGPNVWRTTGDKWCYEYMVKETGIIVAPEIWENYFINES